MIGKCESCYEIRELGNEGDICQSCHEANEALNKAAQEVRMAGGTREEACKAGFEAFRKPSASDALFDCFKSANLDEKLQALEKLNNEWSGI